MFQSSILGLMFLLCLLPAQLPPIASNAPAHPTEDRSLPIDRPSVVTKSNNQPRTDPAQLVRDAQELSKLGDAIPSLVEQANKGVLSKDLNERLKRIEKLSKQLRRELAP